MVSSNLGPSDDVLRSSLWPIRRMEMTQFEVKHEKKPPELKVVWWFSQPAGVVVAVVVTILVAIQTYSEDAEGWIWALSVMLLAEILCGVYLLIGYTLASALSDRRVDYTGTLAATAGTAFVTPWIVAFLAVILAITIACLLVAVVMAGLANS